MSGCSKGARGLFVLSRVLGILTETPISPSLWRRQRPSRYAIRAGRNLPDKEFRYLRTVIVTAAVYRGFGSKLHPLERRLTSPLNLPAPGRRQCLYVVLLDFADTCVFAKQSLGPILCDLLPFPPLGRSSTRGSPSPEVTGTFCRVPSPQVTRAPEATRLAYVCPFPVRSAKPLLHRLFSAAGLNPLRPSRRRDFALRSHPEGLRRWTGTTIARPDLRSCVPCALNGIPLVQEC